MMGWHGGRCFSTMMGWREACRSAAYMALRPVHRGDLSGIAQCTRVMASCAQCTRVMATGVQRRRWMAKPIAGRWQCPSLLYPCDGNDHHPVALSALLRVSPCYCVTASLSSCVTVCLVCYCVTASLTAVLLPFISSLYNPSPALSLQHITQ